MGYRLETMGYAIREEWIGEKKNEKKKRKKYGSKLSPKSRKSLFLICKLLKTLMLRVIISNGFCSYK